MSSHTEANNITLQLTSCSPEETQEIGKRLGGLSKAGQIFLLMGNLGAGKTCLTQGIAWGLGVSGYVRSPTFVMMTRYKGRLVLHHVDLYRIEGSLEALDLGLEEQLYGDGVCVIEWAERAEGIFPTESIQVSLKYGDEQDNRTITITASSSFHEKLILDLKAALRGFGE